MLLCLSECIFFFIAFFHLLHKDKFVACLYVVNLTMSFIETAAYAYKMCAFKLSLKKVEIIDDDWKLKSKEYLILLNEVEKNSQRDIKQTVNFAVLNVTDASLIWRLWKCCSNEHCWVSEIMLK